MLLARAQTRLWGSALGPVAHIVLPGNFHHIYAATAQAAFPGAKTWICPGVERRRPSLKYDGVLGDVAPAAWADEIDQVLVHGARIMREVAMLHRASRTLILVDLIENFTERHNGPRLLEPKVVTNNNREPSPDDFAGAAWWDSLSEPRRADWLEIAGSAKPADAWAAYKRRMVPDQPDELAAR